MEKCVFCGGETVGPEVLGPEHRVWTCLSCGHREHVSKMRYVAVKDIKDMEK